MWLGLLCVFFVAAMMTAMAVSKATAKIFLLFFCTNLTLPFSLSQAPFPILFRSSCLIVVSVLLALPVRFLAAVSKATAVAVSKTSQKVRLVICCCFLVCYCTFDHSHPPYFTLFLRLTHSFAAVVGVCVLVNDGACGWWFWLFS
jgi:hypothetical protein